MAPPQDEADASPEAGAVSLDKDTDTTVTGTPTELMKDVRDFLKLDDDDNPDDSDANESLPTVSDVLSPTFVAQCVTHEVRLDELKAVYRQRVTETKAAFDEHNVLVETKAFVEKETKLLDSLWDAMEARRRRAESDLFTSVSETDEHRFALEGSLRRAKIGTELVLVKSETRRQQTETKVVAATEELDEAEKELDELNDTFSRVAAELKLRCDEVEKLRAESLDS